MIDRETILERRVLKQPKPHVVAGGDCGACDLSGILKISIQEAYDLTGSVSAISWEGMRSALWAADRDGLIDRLIDEPPHWNTWRGQGLWGSIARLQSLEWFKYISMAIDAGYYGFCTVDHAGRGPVIAPEGDHWVVICGTRFSWVKNKNGKGSWGKTEVLISCSAKCPAGRWEDAQEFLKMRGGFNAILARPI